MNAVKLRHGGGAWLRTVNPETIQILGPSNASVWLMEEDLDAMKKLFGGEVTEELSDVEAVALWKSRYKHNDIKYKEERTAGVDCGYEICSHNCTGSIQQCKAGYSVAGEPLLATCPLYEPFPPEPSPQVDVAALKQEVEVLKLKVLDIQQNEQARIEKEMYP